MQGQVLDFSFEKNGGVISGNDSKRYAFSTTQWREQDMPARGMQVDFDVNEQGQACDVYLVAAPKPAPRTAVVRVAAQAKSPEELTLWNYAMSVVKNHYVDFHGRARPNEFWGFNLFFVMIFYGLMLLMLIGSLISDTLGTLLTLPYTVFALGMFLPLLAVTVRRLHDTDKSGWWVLIGLIPLFGSVWLLVLCALEGTVGENQFGGDPRQ